MSDISNTIRLNDQMSEPLKRITGNVERLTERLERLGAVNKSTPDISNVYSRMADKLGRLFNTAEEYKVMQLVGNAFKHSALAAAEFESMVTGAFRTMEGKREQYQGLYDVMDRTFRGFSYSASETGGVNGIDITKNAPDIMTYNAAEFTKAAERGRSAAASTDKREPFPYKKENTYPQYAVGDIAAIRTADNREVDKTDISYLPRDDMGAYVKGSAGVLTALTSAAAAAETVTKAFERFASETGNSPFEYKNKGTGIPAAEQKSFGGKADNTASRSELTEKNTVYSSDAMHFDITADYSIGDVIGAYMKSKAKQSTGIGENNGYAKSDKSVREYYRSSDKISYAEDHSAERYLKVKSDPIRDNGQIQIALKPEHTEEEMRPVNIDLTAFQMFIDGAVKAFDGQQETVSEYRSFWEQAKEKQTMYTSSESNTVYNAEHTYSSEKSSSPVINSVHDLKIFKAGTEGTVTYADEHKSLWNDAAEKISRIASDITAAMPLMQQRTHVDDISRWEETIGQHGSISGDSSDISAYAEKTAEDIFEKYREAVSRLEHLEAPMKTAAFSIMNAYAQGIMVHSEMAISAAQNTADRITAILSIPPISIGASAISSIMTTVTQSGIKQKLASGTRSAMPGLTLVGEEGPELVTFRGGESVFNALETKHIMERMQRTADTSVYIPRTIYEAVGMEHSIGGLDNCGYSSMAIPKEDNKLELSDSDREYLIALSERNAVNNAANNDIKIEMINNNNISSEADVDGIIDHLARGLQNALAMTAEGVHK